MNTKLIDFIKQLYGTNEFIPLHAPTFSGNENKYVTETINSTFVSSVGAFVTRFEKDIEEYTGTAKAVAVVNGTAALHTALYMSGVKQGDLVITQSLTFVATCNALYHMGAEPVFVDVSKTSLGLSPIALAEFLENNANLNCDGVCVYTNTKQVIRAVMPMHTFGHPVELDEILRVCNKWNLVLIEDAAESLGSFYKGVHTGTVGEFGALSFNGNKIITTGGGGMVLCKSVKAGERTKHVTTTSKVPHPYEFFHDEPGFNYRMPNLNAALGCAQMESLEKFLVSKRDLAMQYKSFFKGTDFQFVDEPAYAHSNFWLNSVICPDVSSRDELITATNQSGVMTRPIWQLMHKLPMFTDSKRGDLYYSEFIEKRLVNLPSSPIGT
ncbi:LegC family aminotransferase [Paraglaciecola polaris]|uniref:UDP-bacillosamine synthetase n=1 Tax=Paraglaciecola polaris LMG 21857 TaxID=1129793 RepID=K6ZXH0_9ALTE|nr:LegC family aminotransferase [Paraglaciecola polaris]GAC33443.1 UDP-bacillosamine synthetase [Paraglaciecola polaris LMG 21857]